MAREYWLECLRRIAELVLVTLANRRLKQLLPVALEERGAYAPLEAFGRLLAGLAPWLELSEVHGSEAELQKLFRRLALAGLDAATDPTSADHMNFSSGHQPIVDAAFLAHAIVRAPHALRDALDDRVRRNLAQALKETRARKPHFNNWLLFAAMIETALYALGEPDWDPMRVDYALRQHEQWYLGDGMYSDGPLFHWDYYNSFVIQPMLLDIVRTLPDCEHMAHAVEARAVRHAVIQERLISPEGTFPPIGRSLAYRFGAFQLLAQIALMDKLPPAVSPAQVRCALTAVMRRMMDAPGMFDEEGWLRIGFCGHQREIGESYISTGSLYLCATVFLPLGLTATHPFWADADMPWTACKAWAGHAFPIDKSLAP
jgi:hypothetical protein